MGRTFDLNCICGGMMLGWSSDTADSELAERMWRHKHSGPGHAITSVKISVSAAARLASTIVKDSPEDSQHPETAYVPSC